MKPNLIWRSTSRLEKLLGQVIDAKKRDTDDSQSIYDIIIESEQLYDPLMKGLYECSYISKYYDAQTILELLHHCYYASRPASGSEYLQAFKNLFRHVKNDWLAVIPLDFNQFISSHALTRRTKHAAYTIVPPMTDQKRFIRYFKRTFHLLKITEQLLEHQSRVTGGSLYKLPLMVFPLHGSFPTVSGSLHRNLATFRELYNLFTIKYGSRSTMVSFDQQANPVRHAFLIDRKGGEVERLLLRGGSRFFAEYERSMIRKFERKGFSSLLASMNDESATGDLVARFRRSMHFFSKGFNESDMLSRFLFYVIAAEALFSKDRDTPISSTLADYSSLLSSSEKGRLEMHKQVKKIYSLRSSIVHSGRTFVNHEQVEEAESIVASTLLQCISSLLPPKSLASEDEYFLQLNRLKLRLTSKLERT